MHQMYNHADVQYVICECALWLCALRLCAYMCAAATFVPKTCMHAYALKGL